MDEPSYAVYPDRPEAFVKLFNHTVEGVSAKIGLHICFGNYRGRAVGKRSYRPLFPYILDADFDQLALEFANREMAEIGLWSEFPNDKELAAGAHRCQKLLCRDPRGCRSTAAGGTPARASRKIVYHTGLWIQPNGRGGAAAAKLKTMVAGTEIVRSELAGRTI